MINKKLDLLRQRIKEIDTSDPDDYLSNFISSIKEDEVCKNKEMEPWVSSFEKDISSLIDSYESKGISFHMIGYQMYRVLLSYVRRISIYSYAQELQLDPVLFKDQMRFLFKGKS